ncbi:MAG: carbohydrate kinase [Verrucomicrobiota bacterium JB023]|nr:carbohydrate kinase [Verrucomicrobiota bacterium JB023]
MSQPPKIAGIGELLWDQFPDGSRLGGAPVNFAYHCHQLGSEAYPVSSIGKDEEGLRTRKKLNELGLSDRYITESASLPTGKVLVNLDSQGKPSYQILENVAWDELAFTEDLSRLAASLDAVCFGVLARRSEQNRSTIARFIAGMPTEAHKVCDVNLREPFYSRERVEGALQLATILKLSDEELPVLAGYFDLAGEVPEQLAALRQRFSLTHVAYTRGGDGSLILTADEIDECGGFPTKLVDTVGAGDSFTASLVFGILNQWPIHEVNRYANQIASYVCSQKGATPRIPDELIQAPVS